MTHLVSTLVCFNSSKTTGKVSSTDWLRVVGQQAAGRRAFSSADTAAFKCGAV